MAATRSVIVTFLLLFASAVALAGNGHNGGLSFENYEWQERLGTDLGKTSTPLLIAPFDHFFGRIGHITKS